MPTQQKNAPNSTKKCHLRDLMMSEARDKGITIIPGELHGCCVIKQIFVF